MRLPSHFPWNCWSQRTLTTSIDNHSFCYAVQLWRWIMGQNPTFLRHNQGKNQGDKLKYISNVYSSHHHRRCWPTSIQYLAANCAVACLCHVPRTHDVGLPTQFRFNVGPASPAIAGQCRSIFYDAGHTLLQHRICCRPQQTGGFHPKLFQCWPIVFDAGPTFKQH